MIAALTRPSRLFAAIVLLSALVGAGAAAQAADVQRCMAADECRGPLPQICERCKDGKDACAHWACVHHKCTMEVCPREHHHH